MRHVLDGVRRAAVPLTPVSHAAEVLALQVAIREGRAVA